MPESLDGFCVFCGSEAVLWSAMGMSWCDDHAHRGKVADWAYTHRFPALECSPYAFSNYELQWRVVIACGADDAMWLALSAIECLEKG